MSAFSYENIRGLDVAMNDSFRVRRVQRVCDLNSEQKQRLQFKRAVADQVLQSLAIQELHGDERLAALLADVVNRADVGMVESRRGLRFTLKTGKSLGVFGDFIGQEFQGDKSVQPGVLGLVNHTHPSAAQFLDDAVVRNGLADELGWSDH